jgi:hypothetical protein
MERAMDIGPGDLVECVKGGDYSFNSFFKVGSLYYVEEVCPGGEGSYCSGCMDSCFGLRIKDVPQPPPIFSGTLWWSGCSFRPILGRAGQQELMKELLKKSKVGDFSNMLEKA